MHDLTVVVPVYNEEKRLSRFLQHIPNDVSVLLLDKASNDKSATIANEFSNVEVFSIPFGPPSSEFTHLEEIKNQLQTEWCLLLVVSQTLDEMLFSKIKEVIKNEANDVIELPFKNYTFGMCEDYSPWPSNTCKPLLARVTALNLQPLVHRELHFHSNKVGSISRKFGSVHHNSNINLETFLVKSVNYARQEAKEYNRRDEVHSGVLRPIWYIIKSLCNGYVRQKFTIIRGKRGVLLGTAFVLTQLLILLFVLYENEKDEIS
jgi:glycosyltransferase involved in cell wall biosynthesis